MRSERGSISFSKIPGQKKVKEFLKKEIKEKRVGGSYLFLGSEGVLKKDAALAFAKAINCENFQDDCCNSCPSCRSFDSGFYPELITHLGKITMDVARDISETLLQSKVFARFRVVILDGEKISIYVANSLLKMLEEPPDGTIFIILANSFLDLPKTLVSRCKIVRFLPISEDEFTPLFREDTWLREIVHDDFWKDVLRGSFENFLKIKSVGKDILKFKDRLFGFYYKGLDGKSLKEFLEISDSIPFDMLLRMILCMFKYIIINEATTLPRKVFEHMLFSIRVINDVYRFYRDGVRFNRSAFLFTIFGGF